MNRLDRILARVRAGDRIQISYDFFGSPNIRLAKAWLPLFGRRYRVTPEELVKIKDAARARTRQNAA